MSALKVGLIGYGIAGAVFHAPLVAANQNLRLDAVVTANPQRRAAVEQDHPGTAVVDDLDALLERRPDLVVVASPNRTHYELTRALVDAGVPVVVDKPFVPTAQQGRELIEHAASKDVPLTVFQNRRWDNDLLTARTLIESGELGAVLRFESRFERWVPTPKPGWRESGGAEEAGGVLYDLGSHLVDQALLLFGPVESVYAQVDRRRAGVEVDDDSFVALVHTGGVRSHLWMSKVAAQHGPRFRVLGDRAAYTKYGLDPQEAAMREGGSPADPGWGEEPRELWGQLGTIGESRTVPTEPGRYQAFYDAVVSALRDGGPLPVDPRDSVAGIEIIEAARRSAENGTVERLEQNG
ncbi:putative dehydrogenase [Saccharopolyspora erythraea NRRL 2338]|uniref:Oxidoreductase, Gfo/Idh/MocA family n=2 Tax=Saccharopolyspora erythraea TaxID=1836 RepID=A4FB06_SACEN|nr:Gfo/Idh/MocA family oxidoreductase [Saccharopolyspora erythraea]EQD87610.1 oxidoreductase [Saccharopolyspora erythraea D]PFG95013.1 putative dehydrogenase [Saccharopolyspora erythraea NRRL 2338]QRK91704.1 Gfo/Idh/MocA family oxidoreductase [Saccharopolyspora erythraea]CAM01231.1 oxidoreductase, Gfo/Idh/MocA family [Saccharopolyspora erythraea NRRL 2338]